MFDVVIVLGHSKPTKLLTNISKDRVKHAVELQKIYNIPILFSGKHSGKDCGHATPGTEAKAMKDFALELGAKNLFMEDQSHDTLQNALFTKKICKKKNWQKLIIVSSSWHIPKVRYLFKKVYGSNFKLSFFDVTYDKNPEGIAKLLSAEKKKLKILYKLFGKIKNGDDKSIYSLHQEMVNNIRKAMEKEKIHIVEKRV